MFFILLGLYCLCFIFLPSILVLLTCNIKLLAVEESCFVSLSPIFGKFIDTHCSHIWA